MYLNGTKCQLFLLGCLLSVTSFARDLKTLQSEGIRKPLCFVENKGQVLDENNNSRRDIQFKLSGKGVALYVGNGQLHYQFKDVIMGKKSPSISTCRMDVTLLGANEHAAVTTSDAIDYHENYYIPQVGPEGVTASAYKTITYHDVYPNIDWVLYVRNGKVEYDFVVRPGGDPKQIKIQYNGADKLELAANGSITAHTPMGDVTEKTPVAFETNTHKAVRSRFHLDGNVVSFETGKYNGTLTIDPYLSWCTYFGGTNEDVVTAVKCSTGSNTYATGYTASIGLAAGTIEYQNVYQGGTYDAFAVRYSSTGTISWASYIGGAGEDRGMSIVIDNTTGIYVGGTTNTPGTIFASSGAYQGSNAGGKDMFLLRLVGATGQRSWGTYIGGSGDDEGLVVASDSLAVNNIYIGGKTVSSDMISTDGSSLNGPQDGYIARFTNGGTPVWAGYFGGSGDDEIDGMATNNSVYLSVTGVTTSADLATPGAYQTALNGTNDAFLSYIRTNLINPSIQWTTYIGGSSTDKGMGVASDFAHNIYLTGTTASSDGISSGLSYTNTLGGLNDAFLMKFDNSGNKKWGAYFGGTADDMGNGVAIDQFGNVTIAGSTGSAGIASAGAYQTTLNGTTDAFIAKYNYLGQKIYSTYFGKTGSDFANGLTVDPSATTTGSAIIIGGVTNSTGMSTTGVAQTTYGGGTSDGFVARFLRDTIVSIKQPFIDTLICPGTTFTIRDTVNFNFAPGNIFKVQLSDAIGSFAAPVQIGTVTSSTNGAITCTIPVGTTIGTGYRIRIVSTNPVFTSVDNNVNIVITNALPSPFAAVNSPVCVGLPVSFSSSAPYAVTGYSWSGPASFSSTQQNPSIPAATAANGGTYTVTVTHTNNCPAASATVNLLVNSFIPPTPTDSASSPICANSTLHLYSNSNYPGIFTYHWSGPGGFSSTSQNPVISNVSLADTGYYYVVDTLDGCPSARDSVHISITPTDTPNIVISVAPNDTVCAGTTFHFTASVTNAGFSPTYQWMNGPVSPIVGATFDNWSSPSLVSGTTIWCILTGNVSCPDKPRDTSNAITVTVYDNTPVVNITAAPDTFVASGATVTLSAAYTGTSFVSFQWYVNNVAVPGATSSTLVLTNITHRDTVRYEVISSAVCASIGVSNTIVIHLTTGVANVSPEFRDIDLYPNPNTGTFTIKGMLDNMTDGKVSVEITNALGQSVYSGAADAFNGQLNQQVQLKDLPSGVYLLRLNKDDKGKVFRFVIQ